MRSGAAPLYHEWLTLDLEAPRRTIASLHRVCEIVAQALPDCRYETIEGAGHMVPFTHVERVTPLIAAHLAAAK
jgi:pimeloyl-ACP methyl ester carboxylesterase